MDHKFLAFFLSFVSCTCFLQWSYSINFNVTVSQDGTGDFQSVSDAIAFAPVNSKSRFYIQVKPGVYKEYVEIPKEKSFIALIGDDALTTIILGNRSNGTGFKTFNSATVTVMGHNFMAQSITFKNSAGPQNHQAVALLDGGDQTTYYKCIFLGFQDTLYARGTHFFKECEIYGTVDFIFGDGTAMFQDCKIYARLPNTTITITAQSEDIDVQNSGFSFQNCVVTVPPKLMSMKDSVVVYLGRPWRKFSTVVFMESYLDDVVHPSGWLEWFGTPVNSLFYAEFNNIGPGADTSRRVNWSGYHIIHNKDDIIRFTVENLINGTFWLPETGVPFNPSF